MPKSHDTEAREPQVALRSMVGSHRRADTDSGPLARWSARLMALLRKLSACVIS